MLNWQQVIFKSLFYIGVLSPIVFIACCAIICTSQHLKQKSEKRLEENNSEKKYKKQNKFKYTMSTDITSESSNHSLWIDVENPNQRSYRIDKNHSEMNNSPKDSVKGSFVNVPGKRYFKYSDSILVLPEASKLENIPENESSNFQEELISPKLNNSKKNIKTKYREIEQKVLHSDNTKRKQCKCNNEDEKSYIIQNNVIKQDLSIDNPNFDYVSLNTDPIEAVHKINYQKVHVCDGKFRSSSSQKNVLDNNEKLQTHLISTQKSQECRVDNECPVCSISKEKFVPEIQETGCFQHDSYILQKNHKDFKIPVFQNSNIPIAKRVLEEDQFQDLRQNFYGTENTFQNVSKSTKDELNVNTWNKNNKQTCQFDEKSHPFNAQKYFEEENTKASKMQHLTEISNVAEEMENENQTENVSSTCESTDKEELLCKFWKSLKTKTVSQKRNKAVQTEIPHIRQNNFDLLSQNYANDHSKLKFENPISHLQTKKDVTTQVEGVIRKNESESIQNQKPCISKESPQTEAIEYHPTARSFSTQTCNTRNIENSPFFLPSTYNSNEQIKTERIKPVTIYSRPIQVQTEFHYPCHEQMQSDHTQLMESIKNFQHPDNYCRRPNLTTKYENMYNGYNTECGLQNGHYVCNPITSMNHCRNNQYLNSFNDTRQRQIQKTCFDQEHMPLNNPLALSGQDKYKHKILSTEEAIYGTNQYNEQQIGNKQLLNFGESPNKISATTHQCISDNNYRNNFNHQLISWSGENDCSQENEFYDRNIGMQSKDNLMQYNSKKNSSKMHDAIERSNKEVQTSEEILIPTKECSKQISKEKVKKSNSKTAINTEQVLEKGSAEQSHVKENVLKQVKKMYSHIDQNIHETNKSVINQVEKVLKMKGKWHADNK